MKTLNNMNMILILTVGLGFLTLNTEAQAQSKKYQLQCRAKAKEVAKSAYDQCLSLSKEDEAADIRKEYKAKLAKLKEHYEQKLRKLNLKAKADVKTATAPATVPAVVPSSEVNAALPQKATAAIPATENTEASYAAPAPVNSQDSVATSSGLTETTTPAESLPATSNEPIIQLKEAPPKTVPANEAPTPSESTQPLESAPELTI